MTYSPYSFSRLSTFESCPRKFQNTYILKLPGLASDTTALDKGSYIHHCLEVWPSAPSQFFNLSVEQIEQYDKIILRFVQSDIGQKILKAPVTIGKELDFGLDRTLTPCSFLDSSALLRGSIDRLNYNLNTNTLEVYDYKSGKYKEPRFQSFKQVMMYALWIFRNPLFNCIEQIKTSYVYVEHNMENELIMDRKYIKVYFKEYLDIIKSLESTEDFKMNRTKLCDWCQYNEQCAG